MPKIIISFIFIFLNFVGYTQSGKTLGDVSEKINTRFNEAYRYSSVGDFETALRDLDLILKKEPNLLEAIELRSNIFLEIDENQLAEYGFEKIFEIKPNYSQQAMYALAISEMRLEKYNEAKKHLEELTAWEVSGKLGVKVRRKLGEAEFYIAQKGRVIPFEPENLGLGINTNDHEYLPSFTADGNQLIFTRNIAGNEDFYRSNKTPDGFWNKAKPLEDINTLKNEGAQTISADGSLLIFTACNRANAVGSCDLYFSVLEKEVYTEPQLMPEPINTKHWESQPTLTPNGDVLYFSSNRPGGQGDMDIYASYFVKGQWTKPRNMGNIINTSGRELTPFIHADGQSLYFASDGHFGFGGLDLFLARWDAKGVRWLKPTNLGHPINSEEDEGALAVDTQGEYAYFATNNPLAGTVGGTDIYRFKLYEEIQPQLVTYVKAKVTDAVTGLPLKVNVDMQDITKNKSYLNKQTNGDGTFLIVISQGRDYGLTVEQEGYFFYSDAFELSEKHDRQNPYQLDIQLRPIQNTTIPNSPIVKSDPILLKNIFFNSGSAELLSQSNHELVKLKELLLSHSHLNIEIQGHTDDVGSEIDNLNLSEQRATAVKNWLLNNNIPEHRLSSKGFGQGMPIADNSTPEGRKINRRTAFIVLD